MAKLNPLKFKLDKKLLILTVLSGLTQGLIIMICTMSIKGPMEGFTLVGYFFVFVIALIIHFISKRRAIFKITEIAETILQKMRNEIISKYLNATLMNTENI